MFTVKKDVANEIDVLHFNGRPLFCPFKPNLLVPGQLANQMGIHRENCGAWCPMFQQQGNKLKLYCSTAEINLQGEQPSKSSTNLIL